MKTIDINAIQVNIESPGLIINDNLRSTLIAQIEKLGKFYSQITKCELILSVEKNDKQNNCIAEARIFIPGKMFFSQSQESDFYKAADEMLDELRAQLLRYKEKTKD